LFHATAEIDNVTATFSQTPLKSIKFLETQLRYT